MTNRIRYFLGAPAPHPYPVSRFQKNLWLEFVIESCFQNIHATLDSVKRSSNGIRWYFSETQGHTFCVWKIWRLSMRLIENFTRRWFVTPCITLLGKPLLRNDQNRQERWTIEDQTRAHLDSPPSLPPHLHKLPTFTSSPPSHPPPPLFTPSSSLLPPPSKFDPRSLTLEV